MPNTFFGYIKFRQLLKSPGLKPLLRRLGIRQPPRAPVLRTSKFVPRHLLKQSLSSSSSKPASTSTATTASSRGVVGRGGTSSTRGRAIIASFVPRHRRRPPPPKVNLPKLPKLPPGGSQVVPKIPPHPLPSHPQPKDFVDWLRENAGVLVMNVGSMCTLAAFTRSDILELRLLSITGSLSFIFYLTTKHPLQVSPLSWSSIFVFANSYMVYKILDERQGQVTLTPEEENVYEEFFLPHGVTPRQFEKLLKKAKIVQVPRGNVIIQQGQPFESVYLLVKGQTQGYRPDSPLQRRVTAVSSSPGNKDLLKGGDAGAWIGEMAFLDELARTETSSSSSNAASSNNNATETAASSTEVVEDQTQTQPQAQTPPPPPQRIVVGTAFLTHEATQDSTLLQWSHADLASIMKSSAEMRSAMTRAMTAAVVGKVVNLLVSRSSNGNIDGSTTTASGSGGISFPSWAKWLTSSGGSDDDDGNSSGGDGDSAGVGRSSGGGKGRLGSENITVQLIEQQQQEQTDINDNGEEDGNDVSDGVIADVKVKKQ